MRDGFYGRRLNQRVEQEGVQVVFPGLVWIFVSSVLCTRVYNKNMHYPCDRVDLEPLAQQHCRFRSGEEYPPKSQQLGQAYGHIARILDSSNLMSLHWVSTDVVGRTAYRYNGRANSNCKLLIITACL